MLISTAKVNKAQKELDDGWATLIKAKYGWRCAICGTDYKVCAHHIIPRENRKYRYDPNNGIALCLSHHKFSRVISAHNNPLAFFLWLESFQIPLFSLAKERTKETLKENGIIV